MFRAQVAFTVLLIALQTDWGAHVVTPPGSPSFHAPHNEGARSKQTFSWVVRYVHDGDTFRCSDGTRVRLSAIDTPEMPGACRSGRHCAPGDPYASKSALERLIGGRPLQCERVGRTYNRVAAWCSVGGIDLRCAMLRNGYAIRLPQFDKARRLCR